MKKHAGFQSWEPACFMAGRDGLWRDAREIPVGDGRRFTV
jgi:hypothetical protein